MGGRILVLDDEHNYAAMLQDLLRQNNYQVDMSTKPELAIAQLEEVPYDLVISDYKMPVMDGADFLKRSRELYPNLPVILVSGLMNTPELVKVANMGVTLVFEKPLNTNKFLASVAEFAVPMTEEEKSNYHPADEASFSAAKVDWPEEPIFFSAKSPSSEKALRGLWSCCQGTRYAYVHAPVGSDALVALKDISSWKGRRDLPIKVLSSEQFFTEAVVFARQLNTQFDDFSDVLAIELSSVDQIVPSRMHLEKVLSLIDKAHTFFFVFVLTAGTDVLDEFYESAGTESVVIHPLATRPLDLARYLSRFIRKGESQMAEPQKLVRKPDAVYAMLSYDWPYNYKQVQEIVPELVKSSIGNLDAATFNQAVGASGLTVEPNQRLGYLLKKYQAHCLLLKLAESGDSPEQIVQKLELPETIIELSDLTKTPLIDESLATL